MEARTRRGGKICSHRMELRTKRLRGLIPQVGGKDKEVDRLDPTEWRQGQGG